jgi:hypothetical protein
MINAYLHAANPGAALDLLGEMLDTKAGVEFGSKDIPAPAMSTYVVIVRGFCLMGDLALSRGSSDRSARPLTKIGTRLPKSPGA